MSAEDIRWMHRFEHFSRAWEQLREAVELARQRNLSRLEEQGMIQAFEYTHELAWNTLKDFLESKGIRNLYGSRDTTREAFKRGLVDNGEAWMKMIESSNASSHTYNSETAQKIANDILEIYYAEFKELLEKLKQIEAEERK